MSEIPYCALPWYVSNDDYHQVLSQLPIAERENPLSFDAFRTKLERHEEALKRQGAIPVRIPIDPIELKRWCQGHQKRVCRESISDFTLNKLASRVEEGLNNN